jgi:hypothetical protein
MATRWKHEDHTCILSMHAHNQWSNWNSAILSAAESMGLPVQEREFANHYDGSRDREWGVCTAWLNRVGGINRLMAKAREIHEEIYRPFEVAPTARDW